MKLGSLTLKNNLILAPLQSVTTGPYRRFCRCYNDIGLVCVPMLYTKRLMKCPQSLNHELAKIEEERSISVQLIGKDKKALEKSIEFLESYKFDVLDINAGCPSKRSIKAKEGGYLLTDLNLLKELVLTAVKYSTHPISLKIRTGFEKVMDVNSLKQIINDTGLEFLTVHARTVKEKFNDSIVNYEFVRQIKEIAEIPIVGNGDVVDGKTAKDFLDQTKADGLMIGRASIGNPSIFRQITNYLENENEKEVIFHNTKALMKEYLEKYEKIIDEYVEGIKLPYSPEEYKFMELKRNAIWLTKEIEGSAKIRLELSRIKELNKLKERLALYFEEPV